MLSVGHQKNAAIAAMVGCSAVWVRKVIHRFNDAGIDGITWYPWFQVRSARVFTDDLREQIAEVALSSPIALIGMTQWSLPKLRLVIAVAWVPMTRNSSGLSERPAPPPGVLGGLSNPSSSPALAGRFLT